MGVRGQFHAPLENDTPVHTIKEVGSIPPVWTCRKREKMFPLSRIEPHLSSLQPYHYTGFFRAG